MCVCRGGGGDMRMCARADPGGGGDTHLPLHIGLDLNCHCGPTVS